MKYVCYLRGISPINAPSKRLQAAFEALGFTGAQTIISSGNVVFDSPETDVTALEAGIEKGLKAQIGLTTTAIIRSAAQIAQLVAANPFGDRTHSRESYLTVTFLKNAPASEPKTGTTANGATTLGYYPESKALCAVSNALILKTPLWMAQLEKEFSKAITTRTWNTVLKTNQKLQN